MNANKQIIPANTYYQEIELLAPHVDHYNLFNALNALKDLQYPAVLPCGKKILVVLPNEASLPTSDSFVSLPL